MERFFLGVDGGQSSTTALLGDASGRVVGYGRGGPCNHISGPEQRRKFVEAVGSCVAEACRVAGVAEPRADFAAGCFGFSGGAEDKEHLVREMFTFDSLLVTTDALIALSGATAGEPGIITIAGTGSIAFGRNAAGITARAGGWGYVFGDEGGGFDVTRQALRAALRAEEGWGPPTSLRAKLLDATGAGSANDLLHRFYTPEFPRARIAELARLVSEAASEGDAAAKDILHAAAQQLAALAAAVRRQLFSEGECTQVCYIGGAFRMDALRERFRRLVELEEGNQCGPPRLGPAAGALLEAYRIAGIEVTLINVPELEK